MPRVLIRVFGVALFLSGLLWTLQGLGLVMWPANSFMLGEKEWAAYGVIAAAAGVLMVWVTRRRNDRP
ncbi:hypothetical protein [Croceicoccus naphthovorans]|uniref:Membrane protein n=1 Tax=Croceicoccus naphthovorans TaxID=1348774 RepID=A0A0G3XH62_9SPHN|nr:hypothetical protein [Croceicoccus naphthovorans]AKM09959.1 membrane protein [Croceicoccus naphthovorans]MBB3990879.1 hypothetical protein [Croceicoccus naphthovorans]